MKRSNLFLLPCSLGMALLSSCCEAAKTSIRGHQRSNLNDEHDEQRPQQIHALQNSLTDAQDELDGSSPHRDLIGSTRVVGGIIAAKNRYPYIVSLQSNGEHFCGGVLVAIDVVLTVAHCTNKVKKINSPVTVVIGRQDLSSSDGEEISVLEERVHPNYLKTVEYDNDFALLFLTTATMSKVDYVTVNHGNSKPRGYQSVCVLGWGETGDATAADTRQAGSDMLKEASLRVVPNGQCNNVVGDWNGMRIAYDGFIAESMMCATFKNRDSCQGDSGGPLIVQGSDGESDLLVGLVSWGVGCANDFPGVYARVSSGYNWIRRETCMRSVFPPKEFDCEPF